MSTEALLLGKLRAWRDETARRQGVEGYRVFPNATLEAIAFLKPCTVAELCMVKGIKEAKSRQYGKAVLDLVKAVLEDAGGEETVLVESTGIVSVPNFPQNEPLSVSRFLDGLNVELSGMAARIKGEVTSVDVRERVVYFSLKDKEDESVLNCLIFRYQYDVAGVKIALGDEIIIEGAPDIYKPSGRLSFRVESVEYAGEGALKKAYDELYKKLEGSGVFAPENKRPLPKFPERIAIITSQEGAALGDFTMNLTRVGFQVQLYPTLVEGKRAVFEIIKAIEYFNEHPERYDVLVIVRGGGSLESLQAFNTEALVQSVKNSTVPVLAGIGHERDVSLAALAADMMVSTPTATAKYLSASWDEARQLIGREELFLKTISERVVADVQSRLETLEAGLHGALETVLERVRQAEQWFQEKLVLLPEYLRQLDEKLEQYFSIWELRFGEFLYRTRTALITATEKVEQYNPMRVLQLGYSLIRKDGKLLRRARDVRAGECIDMVLGSGRIEGEVKRVIDN